MLTLTHGIWRTSSNLLKERSLAWLAKGSCPALEPAVQWQPLVEARVKTEVNADGEDADAMDEADIAAEASRGQQRLTEAPVGPVEMTHRSIPMESVGRSSRSVMAVDRLVMF